MNLRKIIREEIDSLGWLEGNPRYRNKIYNVDVEINTDIAQKNFKEEKNGFYLITTPKGKDKPEKVMAFGSVPYIKGILNHLNDVGYSEDFDLYLADIKYSKKDKDNVLTFRKYF
jgi:hypothetical protein